MNKLIVLSVFLLFSWMSANKIAINAPCPDVTPVSNFNLSAYAQDTWYEVLNYPNEWENRGDCVIVTHKKDNDAIKFNITDVIEGTLKYFEGNIDYAPNAGNTGLVNYYASNAKDVDGSNVFPLYILEIDYNRYAIGYECKYDDINKVRYDYAWVASRSKELDDESKIAVDKFLKDYSS